MQRIRDAPPTRGELTNADRHRWALPRQRTRTPPGFCPRPRLLLACPDARRYGSAASPAGVSLGAHKRS
eukprot:8452684-Alexandrium_andersonii.AAC.1